MFRDLLIKTRSYRNFDRSVGVQIQTLADIVEMTRYTPSTANTQPVKYAYTCTPVHCAELFKLLGWAGYIKENKPPFAGNEPVAYIMLCWDRNICGQSPEIASRATLFREYAICFISSGHKLMSELIIRKEK